MISKKAIFWLATLTFLVFGGLGLMIVVYNGQSISEKVFQGRLPWHKQLIIGILYGGIAGILGWKIVMQPFLATTKSFFVNLIQPLHLSWWAIIYISFCAGVGEELLFRGGIQPFLGVWLTAIIFVALHGYLSPWNWRLSIYGVFMTLAIAGIGYMARYIGLVTAIAAHTMIDVYLLRKLSDKD